MRTLVLSDVHANLAALLAVLALARRIGYDRTLALGDLVGYNTDVNETLDVLRGEPGFFSVGGNHDDLDTPLPELGFRDFALAGCAHTRRVISPGHAAFVRALSPISQSVEDGRGARFRLAHGSPEDRDRYITTARAAAESFSRFPEALCFFGHSHRPSIFEASRTGRVTYYLPDLPTETVGLDVEARYLVNPGSVGQPRDGDPRAAALIHDAAAHTLCFLRAEYDVERTRRKVLGAGLPRFLGDRLLRGE